MQTREKLIEILDRNCGYTDEEPAEVVADRLINSGLLKDDMVYKPIKEENPYTHDNNYWCSVCKEYIGTGVSGLIAKYCPRCGVKLK